MKALYALYGRLHGGVRLRWGFLDDLIAVPWVHRDELGLLDIERTTGKPLEVVVGSLGSPRDYRDRPRAYLSTVATPCDPSLPCP